MEISSQHNRTSQLLSNLRPRPPSNRGFDRLSRVGCVLFIALLASCAQVSNNISSQKPVSFVFPPPPEEPRYILERIIRSSSDIVADDENGAFKRLVTGTGRSGEGLAKPYGVAVRDGRIYISDSGDREVKVFDVPNKKFFKIGDDDGPGALRMPIGVALDGASNVYVSDATAKEVKVYTKDGKFLRVIGKKGEITRPAGLAVDKEGKRLYVVDIGGVQSTEHRVRVFNAQTGQHLLDIGKRGDKDGELNLPRDVAIGPDGLLYVVDGGNFRVEVFKTDGTFVRIFGGIGNRSGQFSRPKGVTVDPANFVFVVDTAFGNFQIFSPEGQLMLDIGGRSEVDKPATYMLPAGIASDEDGRIYIVDQFFRRLDIYRPAAVAVGKGHLFGPAIASVSGPAKASATEAVKKPARHRTPEAVGPAVPKG